jgi:hypothetical protein
MGETEFTWYCGHYWRSEPAPDDADCGEIDGMKIAGKTEVLG